MTHAIDVHSEQAQLFGRRYRELREDPYRSAFHYGRSRLADLLEETLGPGEGRDALDAGCGSGYWLGWLADNGFNTHGIDGSEDMVALARAEVPGTRVDVGDVRSLPYGDASFDVALSVEVIRYLPDPDRALAELHRVLRPGGTAIVTGAPRFALHGYSWINPITTALKPKRFTALRQYFTTVGGMRRMMERAGFRDVVVRADFLGPFPWLDRISPRMSRAVLSAWAPLDRRVAGVPGTRNFCNHLTAIGRR